VLRFVLALFTIGLSVYAVIDCLRTPSQLLRGLPKPMWVAVIVLLPLIGPLAWLVAGRQQGPRTGGAAYRNTPVAPDDDPEFLRQVEHDRAQREEDERLMSSWEEDLRRREGGLRAEDARDDRKDDDDDGRGGGQPTPA
jgi:hypothetical protein